MPHMPNNVPQLGDVYWVYRSVTNEPAAFGEKKARPCGCVAPRPFDPTVWTALPRLTTGISSRDLPSPALPQIGLDRAGAWSLRWVHEVHKNKTGGEACRFLGALPEGERTRLATYYRNRHA